MKTGDIVSIDLQIADSTGSAVSFADYTAFKAVLNDFVFYVDNTIVSEPADFTLMPIIDDTENAGLHKLSWTVVKGFNEIRVNTENYASDGLNYSFSSLGANFEVQDFDNDSIMSAVGGGGDLTPISLNASSVSIGDLTEGDSFTTGIITVPLAYLTPWGETDLTGFTISASFKQKPSDTPIVISSVILDVSERTVKAFQEIFNTGMNLVDNKESDTWFLDIQLTKGNIKLTPLKYTIKIVWQKDIT